MCKQPRGIYSVAKVVALNDKERRRRTTRLPFGQALRELLEEANITTPIGNPDWAGFASSAGVNYESMRKSVVGNRQPPTQLMEAVADALDMSPAYFLEYRIAQARQMFDVNVVGLEQAAANLERFARDLEND